MIGSFLAGIASDFLESQWRASQPRDRRLLSPKSPAIPLRVADCRAEQWRRDQAWLQYVKALRDYGGNAEADTIVRRLREIWESENPPVEIAIQGYEAQEYVGGECILPPPTPEPRAGQRCNDPTQCMYPASGGRNSDCAVWRVCLRQTDDNDTDTDCLSFLLGQLQDAGKVTGWSVRPHADRTSYPDGCCWSISTLLERMPSGKVTTLTRFHSTQSGLIFAAKLFAEGQMAGETQEQTRKESA